MADVLEIIVKLTDQASSKAQGISKSLKDTGKQMAATGGIMAAAFTAPIVAGLGKAVLAASDLEESQNAVNVVFGEGSDAILAYGQNSAQMVGLTTSEFSQMATVTGAFLQNVGFNADTAGTETIKLTERAADMASVFNTDVATALNAIQSGLKGEFNPLEQFGVKLNAAAIEAKALEMGLADSRAELTDSMKAAATLELVYAQTAKTQGDFRNNSDSFANSTKILKAEIGNLAAELGVMLLPIVKEVIGWVSQAVAWFGNLSPEIQKVILVVLAVVAAIGPLLVIIGSLITAIGAIIPVASAVVGFLSGPVLAIIAAVIAAVVLLYTAWTQNWGGIQEKTQAVISFVQGLISSAIAFITTTWSSGGANLTGTWRVVWDAIKAYLQTAQAVLQSIVAAIRSALEGDWYAFGENLRKAWDTAWEGMKSILRNAWSAFKSIVSSLISDVKNFFTNTDWGSVGDGIVQGIAAGISSGASAVVNAAKSAARAALDAAKGFLGIRSPSKVFMDVGKQTMQGFILGMQGQTSGLRSAAVAGVAGTSVQTTFNITANYPYQSPRTLRSDIQRLNALYGRGRV